MPPRTKTITVDLPLGLRDEITSLAETTGRSVVYLIARALAAAPDAPPVELDGPFAPLALVPAEDDPPRLRAMARVAPAGRIAAVWTATRPHFLAWAARLALADRAAAADDLDVELRDAANPHTDPARLAALAASEYPRVRALVAANPAAPPAALEQLRSDRDRVVREALAARRTG